MAYSHQYTLTTLKDDIKAWVENTGTDFTANLTRIIQMGELRLLRDLDLELFDAVTSINTANGVSTLTKPSDIVAVRSLFYTSGSERVFLEQRTYEYVKDYGGSGNPLYYAELDETYWEIAPVPTGTTAVTLRYNKRPDGLADVATDAKTWLSKNVPDALLYACLASTEEFLKADDRIKVWKERYEREILPAAKKEARRLARAEYGR